MGWWFNNDDSGNGDNNSSNTFSSSFNSSSKQVSCQNDPKDPKMLICTEKTFTQKKNPDGTTTDTTDERVYNISMK